MGVALVAVALVAVAGDTGGVRCPARWWRTITGRVAVLVVVTAVSTTTGCTPAGPSDPDPHVESSAATSTDRRTDLAQRIDRHLTMEKRYALVRSVVVLVDGETLYERYYQTSVTDSHDIESVTKSVMSTLVGIALAEGKLRSVDQTLAELLPDYASSMKPPVAAITLRQVLTATAGFSGETEDDGYQFSSAKDWTRAILGSAVRPPGQAFSYSNGGAHLLSAILVEATGQSVLEYARQKLFDPLGIESRPALEVVPVGRNGDRYDQAGFAWPIDPQGRHLGASLMKLRPADLAKLGVLYLNEGRWAGRQIVPAAWVREATTNQLGALETKSLVAEGYGYFWWTKTVGDDQAYLAWGYGGQLIQVIPSRGLVIAASCEVNPLEPDAVTVTPEQLRYLADSVIAPLFDR